MSDGQRRLAAIVFSDVVAYTAKMAASESAGLRLRDRHREVWGDAAATHGGTLVDENGDELVLLFDSAVEAVRAALEVLEKVCGVADLELRVGVHSGDVLLRDARVYGDAVNVAARVRAEGEPGDLVASGEVAQAVRNQPGVIIRELGERQLKNVPHPVSVYAIEAGEPGAERAMPSRRQSWLRKSALGLGAVALLGAGLGMAFPDTRNRMVASALVRNIDLLPGPEGHEISSTRSADGTRIAWGSFGSGSPVLLVQTWFTNAEQLPRIYQPVIELARSHRVVHYDGRGFGLSERGVAHSPEARIADLDAVVKAAGLERFSIFGLSAGAPTAIGWAGRHPERIDRMVLFGARARVKNDATTGAIVTLMREHFGTDRFESFFRDFLIPGASPFQIRLYEQVLKSTSEGDDIAAFYESWVIEDVREYARVVEAPTLVAHVRGDLLIPLESGLEVASLIPDAELLILEGQNHVLLPDDEAGEIFRQAMLEFLAD